MENAKSEIAHSERVGSGDTGKELDPDLLEPRPRAPRRRRVRSESDASHGGKTILSDVGIDIARGTIIAIIGPTGTGKSVFLRALNRMNDKIAGFRHDGDVTLNGESIWASNRDLLALRRQVGMTFQRPNPFPMSIRDNVVAGVKAHKLAKGKQLDVIAEDPPGRPVGGGEGPTLRLAVATLRGPATVAVPGSGLAIGSEVLPLDEPTSSLDPVTTEAIEHLIRRLTPGYTVIVVTHNLARPAVCHITRCS